jgi:hypothetical protein
LAATPNGASIIAAMPDGRMLMYNANVDAFTISRKDFTALKGPLAASSFGLCGGSLHAKRISGDGRTRGFA